MNAVEKFRQQVAIANGSDPADMKSYVVMTATEAQALLNEIDRRRLSPKLGSLIAALDPPNDDEVV